MRWTSRFKQLTRKTSCICIVFVFVFNESVCEIRLVVSICTPKQDKTVVGLSTFILMYFHESENVLYMSLYRKVVFVRKD